MVFVCFFCRIGEAAVPGPAAVGVDSFVDAPQWALPETPSFCLGVANPTGISNKLHMLDHFPVGLWHFTETQASFGQQCRFRNHLKSLSFRQERQLRSVVGAPAALRAGSDSAGSWTGVLCFGDCPLRSVPHVWPSGEFSSGRVALSVAHVGSLVLTMATVYCPPRSPTFPRAKELCEELLTPITESVVLGRSGPRAILGDFNNKAGSLDQMKIWQSHGWLELQDLMHQLYGLVPRPTCKLATAPDQIWLSPELIPYVQNMSVWDIFPDHSVLIAGLAFPSCSRFQMQWRLPGHIPWDRIDLEQWSSNSDLGPICGAGSQHVGSSDPADQTAATEDFRSWSRKFELKASASSQSRTVRADTSFYGRGALDRPHPRLITPSVPKHSRDGEVQQASGFLNRVVSRWYKQLRRLQSYLHAIKSPRAAENFLSRASLWHAILSADGFKGNFQTWWESRPHQQQGTPARLPEYPPNLHVAQLVYDDFLLNYRRFEHWQNQKRQQSSRTKMLATAKGVFAITRKPAKESLDCLVDSEDQTITVTDAMQGWVQVPRPFKPGTMIHWTLQDQPAIVHPVHQSSTTFQVSSDLILVDGQVLSCKILVHDETEIHQRLHDLWSPRWTKHSETPTSQWDHICQFAEHHLPRGTFSLPEITVADWRKAVHSFKPTAATGPCGWTLSDLKNMTDSHISSLLDFYRGIENGSPWPKQWNVGLIHLLQKKDDSSQVNGFRPITVTSLFYRVYAGIRAGQLLHQLAALTDAFQCGFMAGRQAANIWYFIGVCLEVAAQQDMAIHGIVADLVKAYNTLPRFPAFRFLRILGVPDWFLNMWHRHLASFQRFFVVRRAVGPAQTACTGFPEGCPLACVAMAATDLVWHLYQSSHVPRALPLSYVDNLEIVCDRLPDLLDSSHVLESSVSPWTWNWTCLAFMPGLLPHQGVVSLKIGGSKSVWVTGILGVKSRTANSCETGFCKIESNRQLRILASFGVAICPPHSDVSTSSRFCGLVPFMDVNRPSWAISIFTN